MPRVYLPLLPVPVLAAIVAFSACSRPGEPTTHVIPAAAPYAAAAPSPVAAPPSPVQPAPVQPSDDAPSEEEVRAFEQPVRK